jgi:heme-degrading monooxygenase HmoA
MINEQLERTDAIHQLRLNRFIGLEPDRIESAISWFKHSQLPVLETLPGFRTMFLGQDLERGTAAGLTFWDSEAALRISEAREASTRVRAVDRAGGSMAEGMVDRYRIIFEHHSEPVDEPTHARLAHWDGVRPSLISDAMADFQVEQLPILQRTDGFCGIAVGANFLLGNTVSVSFWSSLAALESSLEWERDARAAIEGGTGGLTPRSVFADSYEVVLAPALRQLQPWPAWDDVEHTLAWSEPVAA